MDKLDRNIIKERQEIFVLNRKNKLNKKKNEEGTVIVKEKKEKKENKENQFDDICHGTNPKKIFQIYNFINPEVYDIYIFIGKITKEIESLIPEIKRGATLNKTQKEILSQVFKGREIDIFNTKNESGGSVEFVYDIINIDDSINLIKKKNIYCLK